MPIIIVIKTIIKILIKIIIIIIKTFIQAFQVPPNKLNQKFLYKGKLHINSNLNSKCKLPNNFKFNHSQYQKKKI